MSLVSTTTSSGCVEVSWLHGSFVLRYCKVGNAVLAVARLSVPQVPSRAHRYQNKPTTFRSLKPSAVQPKQGAVAGNHTKSSPKHLSRAIPPPIPYICHKACCNAISLHELRGTVHMGRIVPGTRWNHCMLERGGCLCPHERIHCTLEAHCELTRHTVVLIKVARFCTRVCCSWACERGCSLEFSQWLV